jgi:UDP-N-acetylmuramoylalanine--D-glutamate ligase
VYTKNIATKIRIDRHGTLEHYAAVKARLVAGVQPQGTSIVGVDDGWCRNIADRLDQAGKRVVRISVKNPLPDGIYVERETIVRASGGARADRKARRHRFAARPAQRAERGLRRPARWRCDIDRHVAKRLRSFPGLAHRMEEVGRKGSVLFVNDSKATNVDSAAQALACFADIFWIAGGKPKTGGIASLAGFFPRIRKAYLIGEAAPGFAAELDGHAPYEVAGTLERANELAARDAGASGFAEPVVLLSPACASFDQYRNFEVRGDKFRELVRALPGVT